MKMYKNDERVMGESAAAEFDSAQGDRDWLNPINMSKLQKAVKRDETEVVLGGVRYSITYGFKRKYPVSHETVESVRLNRMDGQFVPCGYVSMKRILEFDFAKGE